MDATTLERKFHVKKNLLDMKHAQLISIFQVMAIGEITFILTLFFAPLFTFVEKIFYATISLYFILSVSYLVWQRIRSINKQVSNLLESI